VELLSGLSHTYRKLEEIPSPRFIRVSQVQHLCTHRGSIHLWFIWYLPWWQNDCNEHD